MVKQQSSEDGPLKVHFWSYAPYVLIVLSVIKALWTFQPGEQYCSAEEQQHHLTGIIKTSSWLKTGCQRDTQTSWRLMEDYTSGFSVNCGNTQQSDHSENRSALNTLIWIVEYREFNSVMFLYIYIYKTHLTAQSKTSVMTSSGLSSQAPHNNTSKTKSSCSWVLLLMKSKPHV